VAPEESVKHYRHLRPAHIPHTCLHVCIFVCLHV
jgi:hypothetical protein